MLGWGCLCLTILCLITLISAGSWGNCVSLLTGVDGDLGQWCDDSWGQPMVPARRGCPKRPQDWEQSHCPSQPVSPVCAEESCSLPFLSQRFFCFPLALWTVPGLLPPVLGEAAVWVYPMSWFHWANQQEIQKDPSLLHPLGAWLSFKNSREHQFLLLCSCVGVVTRGRALHSANLGLSHSENFILCWFFFSALMHCGTALLILELIAGCSQGFLQTDPTPAVLWQVSDSQAACSGVTCTFCPPVSPEDFLIFLINLVEKSLLQVEGSGDSSLQPSQEVLEKKEG